MPARRPPEHRHQCGLGQVGDLADGGDPTVVKLPRGDRADAPQPFHRQRMEERELGVGWHHEQTVGLGDRTGNLGEELGAGHPDRDRQADPFEDVAAQRDRDLGRGARDPSQTADIEERLVDRQPFDERCRVLEHREHRFARFGVRRHARVDHDRSRAQPAGLRASHRRAHAVRLRLVAGREDDPRSDDHGLAAQPWIVALLDRRVERVEVGVQDRGFTRHVHRRSRTYVRTP